MTIAQLLKILFLLIVLGFSLWAHKNPQDALSYILDNTFEVTLYVIISVDILLDFFKMKKARQNLIRILTALLFVSTVYFYKINKAKAAKETTTIEAQQN